MTHKKNQKYVETFIRSYTAVYYINSWDEKPMLLPVRVNRIAYHYLKKRGMILSEEQRDSTAKELGCYSWSKRHFLYLEDYRWWEILNMLEREKKGA